MLNNNDNSAPGPSEKTMGRGMLYAFWITLVIGSSLLLSNYESDKYHPNRNAQGKVFEGVRELVLQRNDYGHYIVDGSINGSISLIVR